MELFAIGDMAVYQGQGIGEITEISRMEVGGSSLEVYTLTMDSGTIVRIPTHKAADVGLRGLIPLQDVPEIYRILREEGARPTEKPWNRRYRAYNEKLRTGSVRDIAEVLRDLYRLGATKELSYGERQMLDQARTLLVKELSLTTKRDELDVMQELEELFGVEH